MPLTPAQIIHYYYSGGGAPAQLALYRGEGQALFSGLPGQGTALDYIAFLNVSKDGKWMVAMKGAGHNSPGGSNTIVLYNLETRDEKVLVPASENNGDFPTDPWITVLTQGDKTGRIIVGYHRVVTATTQRIAYTMYSDDDGDTFTEPDLFTDQQDEGGDGRTLAGPGPAIEYNGILLKAMYGQASPGTGNRLGWLYKNESDGEGRWEQVNVIWTDGPDDGTEPCLWYNGEFIICTQRCEKTDPKKIQLFKLADLNSSWQGPVDIGIGLSSKAPIVWDGDMWVMMGRKTGGGGIPAYTYTLDPTAETGWVEPIAISDRQSAHMYGDIVIKQGWFDFYWAQGVFNEPTPGQSGPTIVYKQEMIKSATPIVSPTQYNQYYQLALDYAQGFNIVIPGMSNLRALHNQFIEDLEDAEIWDKIVMCLLFRHNNTELGGFSLYNMKNPHLRPTPTLVNAPAYGVDGYDFNGTDQYINTNFVPNLHGDNIYTQDNAGVFISILDNVSENSRIDIGRSNSNSLTATRGPYLNSSNGSGNLTFLVNDDTLTSVANANSIGRYFLQRRDAESNNKRIWKNGTILGQATVASVGVGESAVYVGCANYANGPNAYSPRKVSVVMFTSSLEGLEAELDAIVAQYEQDVMSL
jgi:hypothetical protein